MPKRIIKTAQAKGQGQVTGSPLVKSSNAIYFISTNKSSKNNYVHLFMYKRKIGFNSQFYIVDKSDTSNLFCLPFLSVVIYRINYYLSNDFLLN